MMKSKKEDIEELYLDCSKEDLAILGLSNNVLDDVKPLNKYQRHVNSTTIDVYDVLVAFDVTNQATAHAIKKLLASGQRGYKDVVQDLYEAMQSIKRAIEIEEGK